MLNAATVSASVDEPEAILDALLQCAVCEVREWGWVWLWEIGGVEGVGVRIDMWVEKVKVRDNHERAGDCREHAVALFIHICTYMIFHIIPTRRRLGGVLLVNLRELLWPSLMEIIITLLMERYNVHE